MVIWQKSEKNTVYLDYWDVTYFELHDGVPQLITFRPIANENISSLNKYEYYQYCIFCFFFERVPRFNKQNCQDGWYGISPTVVQLKLLTGYNIKVWYFKWI